MKTNKYMYPDKQESITLTLIGEIEAYKDYWSKSEERIINKMIKIVKKADSTRILDAGCGLGRLSKIFYPFVNEIIAVEPDYERYIASDKNFREWNMEDKIKLFNCGAEELSDEESFDAIICSHVIQHVPESITDKLFTAFSSMLKSNGALFITTAHSVTGEVQYCESFMQGSIRVERQISQEAFNNIENKEGTLPVKLFTFNHICSKLEERGFSTEENRAYHSSNNNKVLDFLFGIDSFVNLNENTKMKKGRDLFIYARKRA